MKTSEEIYKELKKKYTDEEIAEGFVFNETLSAGEQAAVNEEFLKIRLERLKSMGAQERLMANLLQFKYSIKMYLEKDEYHEAYTFAKQLRKYIKLTNRNNKQVASELDVHPTKLSRILNNRENPNIELMYRLEKHSSNEIPTHYWWRLYARELEHKIKTDLKKKRDEASKVTNPLEVNP
jgi:transcriptional regulator with XRE-family HTH domain